MKRVYFITGSQDLYGENTLRQVKADADTMASFLNERLSAYAEIVVKEVVKTPEEARRVFLDATNDDDCIGVITWMHTFSPAKMWIKGLQLLHKPLLHLHTQANEKLPYASIDMDFMNLNQSAHGDREYAFILKRLNIPHDIVVGYYRNEEVVAKIARFIEVASALDYSRHLKAAMFGSNMREVAVTDGDRVESQIRLGWESNYYGIGDVVDIAENVSEEEVAAQLKEYKENYLFEEKDHDAIAIQARMEIALKKFLKKTGCQAFTDNFQDLHGLRQLPGLAAQDLMAKGVGFGPEGDYKTACLSAVLMKMAEHRHGATGFIEDYTYDLSEGDELELGSHMLEVSPRFASAKPKIEVHPLSIGGKEDPARLVFDSIEGKGIQITMVDLGDRFRLIGMEVELVKIREKMPRLPVARIMWRILPSFQEGLTFWLENGGGHHSVISTELTLDDIALFAKLANIEFVHL